MGTSQENLLWLLSTTSQSSAALVAIIAGFLLSRVLTMSSIRTALVQEMESAQISHEGLSADSARSRETVLEMGTDLFLKDNQTAFVLARGKIPRKLDALRHPGMSQDESKNASSQLASEVGGLCRKLADFFPEGTGLPRSEDGIQAMSELKDVPNRRLLLELCISISDESYANQPKTPEQKTLTSIFSGIDVESLTPQIDFEYFGGVTEHERLQEWIDIAKQNDSKEENSAAVLKHLQSQISKSRKISGFLPSILLLSTFGLVGIAGPMVASQMPFPNASVVAWVNIATFCVFFMLFVLFMVNEAYRIKKSQS